MTESEIILAFKTPLTSFKHGLVIQKILLELGASNDEDLASYRSLATLEGTELRSIFLALYPEIILTLDQKNASTSLKDMQTGLLPFRQVILRAVTELDFKFPAETLNLLKDYLVKESPLHFVAVSIFVITAMVLIEAGEI